MTNYFVNMGHWGERLEKYLELKMPGRSWNKRAKELDFSGQNLSNWRNCKVDEVPGELVSKLIGAFPAFDPNYLYREDWPVEKAEMKEPASDLDQKRAQREKDAREQELVNNDQGPPTQTAEFMGGVFEIAGNKITIDLIIRGPDERADLGRFVPRIRHRQTRKRKR